MLSVILFLLPSAYTEGSLVSLCISKFNILGTELKFSICSYRINKEMNHNSLDEDRAPEPSNPQSAHIDRHGRCCY